MAKGRLHELQILSMCAPHLGILIDFGYSHQGHKLLLQHLPAPSVAAGHARPPAPNIVRMNWSDGPPPTQLRNGDEGLFLTSPGRGAQRGSALRKEKGWEQTIRVRVDVPDGRDRIRQRQEQGQAKGEQAEREKGKREQYVYSQGKRKLCTVAGLAWS